MSRTDTGGTHTRLLYGQSPVGIGVTVIVAVALGAVVISRVPSPRVGWWLTSIAFVSVGRYMLWCWHRRAAETSVSDDGRWRHRYQVAVALSAAAFGAAGPLFAPYVSFQVAVLLAFTIGGMALGAIPLLAPVLAVYTTYALLLFAPFTVWLLWQGGDLFTFIGLMGVVLRGAVTQLHRLRA